MNTNDLRGVIDRRQAKRVSRNLKDSRERISEIILDLAISIDERGEIDWRGISPRIVGAMNMLVLAADLVQNSMRESEDRS